jgi:hypothetical protein
MADSKISDLAAVTDVQPTDEYVLARAGASKKIDASDMIAGFGGGLFSSYAQLRDEKTNGTASGTPAGSGWRTRTLNTETFDPDGIVTLSSNQFTLDVGAYFMVAAVATYNTNRCKLRIRNITDTADALIGINGFSQNSNNGDILSLEGRVSIAGTKTFELQEYFESLGGAGQDQGVTTSASTIEVYASLTIYKEA